MTRHTHGLRSWMLQRITAIYLGSFLVYFVARLLLGQPLTAATWHAWITHPLMRMASAGFILAVLTHVWVGLRSIALDYVTPIGLRLVLLSLIGLVISGCGLWALQILMVTPA